MIEALNLEIFTNSPEKNQNIDGKRTKFRGQFIKIIEFAKKMENLDEDRTQATSNADHVESFCEFIPNLKIAIDTLFDLTGIQEKIFSRMAPAKYYKKVSDQFETILRTSLKCKNCQTMIENIRRELDFVFQIKHQPPGKDQHQEWGYTIYTRSEGNPRYNHSIRFEQGIMKQQAILKRWKTLVNKNILPVLQAQLESTVLACERIII